jgi:hypothetical protein
MHGRDVLGSGRCADARGAAVAHEVEAERVERSVSPAAFRYSVTTFDPGARLVLTHGLLVRPFSTGLLRQQPAPIITLGFDGVGAARDRGDDHRAVVERGDVVATATATAAAAGLAPLAGTCMLGSAGGERRVGLAERHTILRALRAREAGLDGAKIHLDRLRVRGVGRPGGTEQALRLCVSLHQRDLCRVAPGEAQVVERHVVDREDRDGGAVLRAHVAERRTVRHGEGAEAFAEELDEHADDAHLAQPLGNREHEVRRGGALREAACQAHTQHLGYQHGAGLAQHRGLGLDAADAPAHHAQPLTMVVCESVPTSVSGYATVRPSTFSEKMTAREPLDVDLVDDAGVRGDHREVVEGPLAPAEEGIPLAVA